MSWQLIVTHKIENTGLKFSRKKMQWCLNVDCLWAAHLPLCIVVEVKRVPYLSSHAHFCYLLNWRSLLLVINHYLHTCHSLSQFYFLILHISVSLSLQLSVLSCLPAFFVALALLLFQCLSRLKELLCRSTRSLGYRTAACGGTQIHTEFHSTHNSDWSTRSV